MREFSVVAALEYHLALLWEFRPEYWIRVCGYALSIKIRVLGWRVSNFSMFNDHLLFYRSCSWWLHLYRSSLCEISTSPPSSYLTEHSPTGTSWWWLRSIHLFSFGTSTRWCSLSVQFKVLNSHPTPYLDNSYATWLRKHTVHIKGLPVDMSVNQLQYNIQSYLRNTETEGSVLWVTILPNHASLLDLEISKVEYDIFARYLEVKNPPILMYWWIIHIS